MSDSNLIYKISLGITDKREKGAIIDIIDNSQQDKKPKGSIFIYAGVDGKLGTADDRIKGEGNVLVLNKNTLEKCLDNIKTANESDFDTNKETDIKAEKITRENMFSLGRIGTGEELTKALKGEDQDKLRAKEDEKKSFETTQLLRMGFSAKEAAYITGALNNADVSDADKAEIMKKLESINVSDPEADKKRKEAVAFAFKAIPVNEYEAMSANKYLKKQLDDWWNDDEHGFHYNFTNKLTPHNIMYVWMKFEFSSSITNPCAAINDDFDDTPEIIGPAFNKILQCIKDRARLLDIKLDANKLAEAQVYCNALTKDDAWDGDVNAAEEAIKALIGDLKDKEG